MAAVGPPLRLLTPSERKRRRRVRALAIAGLVSFAVVLTIVALNVATKPNADVHLGDDTFRVGHATELARAIKRDEYPLLFQDLRDKAIDIFVSHDPARDNRHGWRAIEAHAPNASRSCQLTWTGSEFKDPCDATTFPADGTGLRRFKVTVLSGWVYVNFRQQL